MDIDLFIKELRESADIQYTIFTEGSCYRLGCIIKAICPDAVIYWSDVLNHAITKVGDDYYDIGGKIKHEYVINNNFYVVHESQHSGYKLLKWLGKDKCRSAHVEKYI